MSDKKLTDHNAAPLGDGSGLRGGTEGGRSAPLIDTNHMPSNATAGSPAGPNAGGKAGTSRRAADDTAEPTEEVTHAADATRHPSQAEAARRARDAAGPTGTHSGFNEGDMADRPGKETSDGTRAATSGRKLDGSEDGRAAN